MAPTYVAMNGDPRKPEIASADLLRHQESRQAEVPTAPTTSASSLRPRRCSDGHRIVLRGSLPRPAPVSWPIPRRHGTSGEAAATVIGPMPTRRQGAQPTADQRAMASPVRLEGLAGIDWAGVFGAMAAGASYPTQVNNGRLVEKVVKP